MSQLSAETFVAVGHQTIQNLGGPMAVLLPLALLSALVTLAHEMSWSHEHLIARFRQLTGTTPTPFQAQTPQFGTRGPDVRP